MPSVSPAINIGIGNYGVSCMSDLASNFCLRESLYVNYVSFHKLNLVDGRISMHNFNFVKQNFQEYIVNSNGTTETEQELHSWHLHNFISQAYNSLITLTNKLALNINFHAIQINLIFAAYEIEHLELLKDTILMIDQLRKQGDFGDVRVKCFSILSDGDGVATPIEEENIVKTLDAIVAIRNNYDILSHNFILDDKNTQAVSLKVANNYLGFAISEIIVVLIRNEYAMLGALHNANGVVSIGIGMVYFDKYYFNAFIKNKILESKIEIEKIHGREVQISTDEYGSLVQSSLLPYVGNSMDVDSVIKTIQEVTLPGDFKNTLRCYEFLLTNLLGQHDRISLVEPIEAEDLYSINDLIYNLLYHHVLTDEKKETLGLLELKNYKDRVTVYNAEVRDGLDPTLPKLKEEQNILSKHKAAVETEVARFTNKTWITRIKPINSSKDIVKRLEDAKKSLTEEDSRFKNKNFIARYFSRKKYLQQKENSKERIQGLIEERKTCDKNEAKLKSDLLKLYALKENLEKQLKTLDEGINDIFSLKSEYQKEIDNLPYLDYEFIHNIISNKKLKAYEKEHRAELQSNIEDALGILYNGTSQGQNSFRRLLDAKISRTTDGLIDFKMSRHLLNEYDTMDLLIPFNFEADLKKLNHRSAPFFNAIPTYTNISHYLKYFDNSDKDKTKEIQVLLEENYTASVPTTIHSESSNKFALITIEVIEDLKSIVKYNNHLLKNTAK